MAQEERRLAVKKRIKIKRGMTVGIDLGDRWSRVCILDKAGEIVEESAVRTTAEALRKRFESAEPVRIAIEVGTHSPWVSRVLKKCGHEVLVANARKLRLIYRNDKKSDKIDAQYLARLARVDPKLLAPIQHRGAKAQADLALLRSRDSLVKARTQLVNHVRGVVKAVGERLPSCSTESFHRKVNGSIPEVLVPALKPVVEQIQSLTEQIRQYDKRIEWMGQNKYLETNQLRQVSGVGPLTSLAYVLTIEDPKRFSKSREVGSFLGLRPRQSDSGKSEPQLRITKAGDECLRRLLVGSAQYILGPFGPKTDLREWGLGLAKRGGKNAKKRAVVAVARKLSVLLHRLWVTGEDYEPHRKKSLATKRNEERVPA